MKFKQLPSTEMVQALQTEGRVDAAWLLDRELASISGDPAYKLVVTQPPGDPFGGFFLRGRTCTRTPGRRWTPSPAPTSARSTPTSPVITAKMPAQVVDALAKAEGVPNATLVKPPLRLFNWEIPAGTTDRIQQALKPLGVLSAESQPESKLVDTKPLSAGRRLRRLTRPPAGCCIPPDAGLPGPHVRRTRTACQAASARASPAAMRSSALVGCAIHNRAYSSVAPIQSAWNIRGDSDLIRPA